MNNKMNKLLMALMMVFILISTQDIAAQTIELNGFSGIILGGKARLYDGDFRINDSQNYGGKLSVGLSSSTFAEVSYMRTGTEGRFYPYYGTPGDLVPFSGNYLQVGGLQQMNYGRVAPFITIGGGLTWWSPQNSQYNGKTQFSATFGGGIKLWLTDFLGIRLQGSMLMPMVLNGFGFGCGIGTGGSGCGSTVYTRITPFQGEFSGGIIIKFSPN